MLPEDQKRILGYFIEEAKDHLNTIEQGLINLQATIGDSEMINEVFRAAHSVKGGAAMLGLNSIQRTAHRMEDFFKVMKESPVQTDREMESLLLQIFDGLQEQLEQLQSPYGLTDDQAQGIITTLEPIFDQAERHLNTLAGSAPVAAAPPPSMARPAATATASAAPTSHPENSAVQLVFRSDIPELLREMLATFKQADDKTSRQQLAQICQRLHSFGEQLELPRWSDLTKIVGQAIGNYEETYRTLAPVAIRDLKQAQEMILANQANQVAASAALLDLVPPAPEPITDESALDALLAEALSADTEETNLADLFATAEAEDSDLSLIESDDWLDQLTETETSMPDDSGLEAVFGNLDINEVSPPGDAFGSQHHPGIGPQVGAEELNSLANLFEGGDLGLEDMWEEEDFLDSSSLAGASDEPSTADIDSEFADLFQTGVSAPAPADTESDDMASLFGDAFEQSLAFEESSGESAEEFPVFGDEKQDPEPITAAAHSAFELEPAPNTKPDLPAADVEDFFELASDHLHNDSQRADVEDFFAEEPITPAPSPRQIQPDHAPSAPPKSSSATVANASKAVATPSATGPTASIQNQAAPPELHPDRSLTQATAGIDSSTARQSVSVEAEHSQPDDDDLANLFDQMDQSSEASLDSLPSSSPPSESSVNAVFDLDQAFDEADLLTEAESLTTVEEEELAFDPFGDLSLALDPIAETTPPLSAEFSTDEENWFIDLDNSLLTEDIAIQSNGGSAAPPTITEESAPFPANNLDTFDDLDALLEEELPAPSPSPAPSSATAPSSTTADLGDVDFDDLEKLLQEADQLGGSSPTAGARRNGVVNSRAPRRAPTQADQTMRVSVSHLDNLNNLVGELVVNRNSLEQDQERLRQFLDNLLNQVQQLNDVGQRMRDLYERSLLESSLMANRQAFALGSSSSSYGGSHATGATFDALEMDRFTGFHTLSQEMIELIVRVREASSDIEFTIDSTDQIARQFRQVTTQLQEGLNKARMVPFGQTAERLPRAVRDISIKCGKEANLVVEGRDTLIDKMILERLYDPMTHLVNNAITHGIESPEERMAMGKPREGTITVRAFYQGNQTVIYIADNGAGINPIIVKAKALQKGLITPAEAQTMSDLEVYDLLFEPGFSTRDKADDFSGRGVGMDVVRTALADIRGSITIESEVGKGTSFTIRLPLTLSITKALSCINNQARIAFPIDGVEDMFDVPKERIQVDDQGHSSILWRDTLLPFRPLGDLLKFNRSLGRGRVYGGSLDEDMISIVVLRNASTFIGLQVDQVIGEQEIVIKQLEGPVPKPTGIAGATVLGDGRVMPIADVLELIDMATGRVRREVPASLWSQPQPEEPEESDILNEPTVLIVDDSITVRELLSMSFNKVGYRVEQARDGQEAWEKLRAGLPCDLVFCDIEMPRMDGLELLSRIQKDEALNQIPIAMLTSRGADRHRQMALDLGAKGYFTKPYLEEMLLDAAQRMLKGETMITLKGDN